MFFKRSVFRIRGVQEPDPRLLIVGIDDITIFHMEEAGILYPFPRTLHAALIHKLADAGVRFVMFDILFSTEAWDISEDEALRDAILYARDKGTDVVLACAIQSTLGVAGIEGSGLQVEEYGSLEDPTDTLLEANPILATVHTGAKLSYKEIESAITPHQVQMYYSQATQVYRLLLMEQGTDFDLDPFAYGIRPIGDSEHGDFFINYIGPDGTVPNVNFALLFPEYVEQGFALKEGESIEAPEEKEYDLSRHKGGIVLVGSQAEADNDYFMTPFGQMFGVETNAQALNTLLSRRWVHTTDPRLAFALVVLLALLAWAFAVNMRPLSSFIAFAVVLVAYETLIVLAFTKGNLLMPFTYPSVTFFFSFFFSLSFRVLTEEAEKRRIRST